MTGVLFVCLGNICRSPLAQGIFEKHIAENGLLDQFYADSAGTSAWHEGSPPDPGSVQVATKHGLDISRQRSRPVSPSDKVEFKWFIAMDRSNERNLKETFAIPKERVKRILEFHPGPLTDVPDPYSKGIASFQKVYELLEESMPNLIDFLTHNDR